MKKGKWGFVELGAAGSLSGGHVVYIYFFDGGRL